MTMDQLLGAIAQLFRYLLPVAGVVALVYLAILFKKVIETLKEFDKTLGIVNEQVRKLDTPLETIENVSKSVDDVNTKAREVVVETAKSLDKGSKQVKEWLADKKADGTIKENVEKVKSVANDVKDTVVEKVNEKREDRREFPVYHSQEEE